jgi:FkbM family methyltransferase
MSLADPPYEPVILAGAALREVASLFTDQQSFDEHEAEGSRKIMCYRLRDLDHIVCIRHGTHDLEIVHELFVRQDYRLPSHIRLLLAQNGPPALNVVDLGANIGAFSIFVQSVLPVAGLVSIEADAENFSVLEACKARNPSPVYWRLVQCVATTSSGSVPFLAGRFASSRVALDSTSPEAKPARAMDVLPVIQRADLVKMDIEGSEWRLLCDPRLAEGRTKAIVLEYHEVFCPGRNLYDTAKRLLEAAGFVTGPPFNEYLARGMLWAWRED